MMQLGLKQIGEVSKEEEDEVNGLNFNHFVSSKPKVCDCVFCTTDLLARKNGKLTFCYYLDKKEFEDYINDPNPECSKIKNKRRRMQRYNISLIWIIES